MRNINLKAIRIDGGTQSRVSLSQDTVTAYIDALNSEMDLPPVIVFHDGADYWLADGFHRFHAYVADDRASIPADVRVGTQRDAVLYSVGANAAHGLQRTNADKRRAVTMLLEDAEWAAWSDSAIAKQCAVSGRFVGLVRADLKAHSERFNVSPDGTPVQAEPTERKVTTKHGTETTMKVDKIGKTKAEPTEATEPATADTEPKKQWKAAKPDPEAEAVAKAEADALAQEAHGDVDMGQMLEELQAENERLQALVDSAMTDKKSAEIIKVTMLKETAERRQSELMQIVAEREKELQKQARIIARIGKAVGEENPAKVAAVVEKLVLASKVAA
jgi:hypothetical protein